MNILIAASAIVLLSLPAAAQETSSEAAQPLPTLRLSTRVVAISAVVRRKDGQPAPGLTRDDFTLRQDGQPVTIRYFSQGSELPLTIAVMVDTSASQMPFLGDESLAADVFLDAMLGRGRSNPGDRATLVQFDSNVLSLAPLSGSPNTLHLALLRLDQPHASRPGVPAGTLLYDAIAETAGKSLAAQPGRKAMVLLTDGDDHGSTRTLEGALEAAQRADTAIYAVDYTLATFADPLRNRAYVAGGQAGRLVLDHLAEATGGRVFTVTAAQGLRAIFAEISQDLRLQYELGYTPPAETKPNTLHKLELKPVDKHLTVQARKAFYSQP